MYQEFHWFKADFQVQTPEDGRHRNDADLRLGNLRRPRINGELNAGELISKARTFLRRCYELELQIIGITDHNFSAIEDPQDWFLTQLVQQNKSVDFDHGV
ncbi:hypothetical protein SAMN04488483_0740 [Pseudomonas helmanticensis]|uniref:Uncharacterized protein n=1 Tax=Pseudomonas helmanticensis TaxID=1471381 RepID=A0ACD2U107_9PSED|nr:hypothetical protein [Pseudomonas helmanticensis]SMQ23077.1 hypothetical protein SAMN04488483_0740 [Pseudomonas helmanticensis]